MEKHELDQFINTLSENVHYNKSDLLNFLESNPERLVKAFQYILEGYTDYFGENAIVSTTLDKDLNCLHVFLSSAFTTMEDTIKIYKIFSVLKTMFSDVANNFDFSVSLD